MCKVFQKMGPMLSKMVTFLCCMGYKGGYGMVFKAWFPKCHLYKLLLLTPIVLGIKYEKKLCVKFFKKWVPCRRKWSHFYAGWGCKEGYGMVFRAWFPK